jgi:predicted ATPase
VLERVEIQNFRCLRKVKAPLRPLTVLIGPNDSGKSAFLAALKCLADASLEPGDYWRLDSANAVTVRAVAPGLKVEFGLMADRNDYGKRYHPVAQPRDDPTRSLGFFLPPSQGVPMTSQGYSDEGAPPELDSGGGMIPALLDHLLRRDRERFSAFVDALKQRVPGLEDVHVATPSPQERRIDLKIDNELVIKADQASVGVRLMLFFVALTYHPSPPKVILLEEPENGVHPRRLGDITKLLRDITQGVHCGHPAQVILTTHSPYLLDHVDLDQDQVLVFRRQDDGSRTAEPVDKERLKTFLDEFMLGEVWFNQQEDGLVGRKG